MADGGSGLVTWLVGKEVFKGVKGIAGFLLSPQKLATAGLVIGGGSLVGDYIFNEAKMNKLLGKTLKEFGDNNVSDWADSLGLEKGSALRENLVEHWEWAAGAGGALLTATALSGNLYQTLAFGGVGLAAYFALKHGLQNNFNYSAGNNSDVTFDFSTPKPQSQPLAPGTFNLDFGTPTPTP